MLSVLRKKIISGVLVCFMGMSFCPVQAFSWSSLFGKKTKTVTQVAAATKKWSKPKIFDGLFAVALIVAIAYYFYKLNRGNGGNGANGGGANDDDMESRRRRYMEDEPRAWNNLQEACRNGDLERAQESLNWLNNNMERNTEERAVRDRDFNLTHAAGENAPLYLACRSGHLEIVRLIVDSLGDRIDFGRLMNFGGEGREESIFDVACDSGNDDLFKFLARIDFNSATKYRVRGYRQKKRLRYYKSPLHTACEKNKLDLARWLVEEVKYDDVDVEEIPHGKTPLKLARENGHKEIVDYLISRGAGEQKEKPVKEKKE